MLMAGRPTRLSDLFASPRPSTRPAAGPAPSRPRAASSRRSAASSPASSPSAWPPGPSACPTGARPRAARRAGAAALVHAALHRCRARRLPPRPRHRASSSTRCSCTTSRSEQGITLDEDAIEALATPDGTFDPYPVYAALAQACASVPDFSRRPRGSSSAPSPTPSCRWSPTSPPRPTRSPTTTSSPLSPGTPTRCGPCAPSSTPRRLAPRRPRARRPRPRRRQQPAGGHRGRRSGSHLVVHGPPGTGKSQTIANLIATLAADGQAVLFVAEKRAAIDAVVGRLDRVGLGRPRPRPPRRGARPAPGRARARRRPRPAHRRRPAAAVRARRDPATAATGHGAGRGPARGRRPPRRPRRRPARAAASRGASRSTRCRRPSRRSPPCPRRPGRGCGCAGRRSPGSTASAVARPRPPATTLASLADWDGAGARRPVVRRRPPRPPTRPPRRATGSSGSPGRASTPPRARSPTCSAASTCPRRPRRATGAHVLATVGDVRDTLETFRPEVFDIPLDDLVAATGTSAYRREVGADLGFLDRWRLRRQARALLRPGRPPADLHAALAAASEQRVAWRQLAGSGGRPEIPVDLDRARGRARRPRRRPRAGSTTRPRPARDGTARRACSTSTSPPCAPASAALAAASGRLGVAPGGARGARRADGVRAAAARRRPARPRGAGRAGATRRSSGSGGPRSPRRSPLRDPRVAAHDGRALSRTVADFAEADRDVVVGQRDPRPATPWPTTSPTSLADHPEQESLLRAEARPGAPPGAAARPRHPLPPSS